MLGSEPIKEKPAMIVTCPQCQKKYHVDQSQFHEAIKYLRCQACGRTFQLAPTPPETPSPESGLLELTCPGCKKVYKIDKNLVTPEMSTIPCKTCGLLVPIEVDLSSEPEEKPSDDQKDDVQPEILSWTAASGRRRGIAQKRKKTIIFCAAAGIFLLIVTAAYLGFKLFYKKEALPQQSGQMPSKDLEVLSSAGLQPLIYMDVDLALLLRVIENQVSAEQKNLGYRIATAIYDSFSPERGHLFLYPDPEYQFLPVLLVQSKEKSDPKESLIKKGILNQFLDPSTQGTYRIKREAAASVAAGGFPVDIYRVWFFEKSAVLGPKTLSPLWAMGEKTLLSSGLVRFADFARKSGNLAVISFRTADIRDGWEKTITEPLVQDSDPQVAVIARMVGNVLSKLTKPFKEINFLAIGFKFSGEKERILSYIQEFRDGVKGAQIYEHLKNGSWEDPDTEGLVLNLVELLNDERLGRNIGFEKNRLSIDLIWSEEDDESVFQSLADATVGYILTQSPSSGEPTAGPIEPQYVPAPQLVSPVNVSKIKGTIPEAVKNSLFPSHYWRLGDKPRMNLELDPIALPNDAIAELSYEILSIGVPGGKNVLRKEDSPLNRASGSFITLPVLKGTRGEDLGIAHIRLHMTLPVKLKIFKFRSDAGKGTVKKADGISVKLDRLEKDVASVAFRGGKGCHLYALDKTGRTLASLESLGSPSHTFSRFQGIIDTLEAVVVSEVLEHSFDIKVDLNNGKELELPEKPDHSVPVRHDRKALLSYADFSRQDLNGLAVKWSKEKTLSLDLPKSPFYGDAIWETHFFDENKPALLAWDPMEMGGKFVVYFRKPLNKIPDAAFGRVRLELSTGIQRVTFSKKSGNGRTVKRLPSGQKVAVTFDKNQITYSAGKSRILQFAAYDSTGKQLKIGKYTSSSKAGKIRRFWGQPTTVVLDIATQKIVKTIPFDLQYAPVDRASYQDYKKKIDRQREIVSVLKAIDHSRKKYHQVYGETLAGLFYIHHKNQQPLMLIDKAVAHSDPAGRARYGYTLKPYKGYRFSYLTGTEENGIKTDYQRQAQEKTFTWQKGSFKINPYYQQPDIAAIPVDSTQPAFVLFWGEIFMKYLEGSNLKYIPRNIHTSDWAKARFVNG